MVFGLVTKRELDQLREELTQQLRKGQAFEQELEYEWAKWYDKFRSLYARLLKREKSDGSSPAGGRDAVDGDAIPGKEAHATPVPSFPHSRRGF